MKCADELKELLCFLFLTFQTFIVDLLRVEKKASKSRQVLKKEKRKKRATVALCKNVPQTKCNTHHYKIYVQNNVFHYY